MKRQFLTIALLGVLIGVARAEGTNWIAILQSAEAPLQQKADACRELARTGGPEAVPVLAALLGDEQLAHRARGALQAMGHPAADAALREAVGRLTGLPRVGVIASLGARRDVAAVPLLIPLLNDGDAEVAAAAAAALGRIGDAAGGEALLAALAAAPADRQPALADGCLFCAERLDGGRGRSLAGRLVQAVAKAEVPESIRLAALRQQVRAGGKDGVRLLGELLRSDDALRFGLALGEARRVKEDGVTRMICSAYAGQPADRQVSLLWLLGDRGDAAAAPWLLEQAATGGSATRVAAIGSLGRLGQPATVGSLVGWSADPEAAVAEAAQAAMAGFPEGAADSAIIGLLADREPAKRMLAIKLAGQRRLSGAVPGLLRLAGDADAAVGDAALKVLTDLAGPAEVPALIGVLKATQARAPAERALLAAASRGEGRGANDIVVRRAVYGKLPDGPQQEVTKKVEQLLATGVREFVASNEQFGDTAPGLVKQFTIEFTQAGRPGRLTVNEQGKVEFPPAGMAPAAVSALCEALPAAGGEVKLALLRILRVSGSDQALARVRAAAGGDDVALRDAAQRLLCDWPADNGLPAVRELAAGATDPKIKILALRGLIRLIPVSGLSVEQKAEELGQVSTLATRTEEKLQVVAALGEVHAEKSLAILESLAADPQLKQAAELAAAAVRAKLSAGGK